MPHSSNASGEEKSRVYDFVEEKERRLRKAMAKLTLLEFGEAGLIDESASARRPELPCARCSRNVSQATSTSPAVARRRHLACLAPLIS